VTPCPSRAAGGIEGVVRTKSESPIRDVSVVLVGTSVRGVTDWDGHYAIGGVVPGAYPILFLNVGYRTTRDTVLVAEGNTTRVDVVLEDEPLIFCAAPDGGSGPGASAEPEASPFDPDCRGDALGALLRVRGLGPAMYGELSPTPGNFVFSPLSMGFALDIARLGAAGATRVQMDAVLPSQICLLWIGRSLLSSVVSIGYASRYLEALGDLPGLHLTTTQQLWRDDRVTLKPGYLRDVKDAYDLVPQPLGFARDPESARNAINAWAAEHSRGRIDEILPEGVVHENTMAVIAGAITFEGDWQVPFPERATRAEPFHVGVERGTRSMFDVEVPTMHRVGSCFYADGADVQVLELPYRGNLVSLVILLPRESDGLATLETELTDSLGVWLSGLGETEVSISLPRFSFSGSYSLIEPLKNLGMTAAFSPDSADFSVMTDARPVWIEDCLHEVYINVDETGTEAGAATEVVVPPGGIPPVEFRADHPFLFVIRDNTTGLVLFLGRVVNPDE